MQGFNSPAGINKPNTTMKLTKKQIAENTRVTKGTPFVCSGNGFNFDYENLSFAKQKYMDNVFLHTEDYKECKERGVIDLRPIPRSKDISTATTKKEFVNAVYDYVNDLY